MTTITVRFEWRKDIAADWASFNPVPLQAEPCWETDTGKLKVGDGVTPYNSLPYFGEAGVTTFNTRSGAVTLTSGDVTGALGFTPYNSTNPSGYTSNVGTVTSVGGTGTVSGLTLTGTITGSGSLTLGGTLSVVTANIANSAVTLAKMADIATAKLIGRVTAGTGVPEELSLTQVLDLIGSAAQGDILYRGSSAWSRLGAGTAGQFLRTAGSGADPTWANVGGNANAYPDVTGEYHLNVTNAANLSTASITANSLTLYPLIPLANDMTIAALAAYVTTGVAGNVRIGIYADNGGKPDGGALIVSTGALSTTTTNSAIEGAVSTTLARGTRYWLALLSDAGATFRGIALGSTLPLPVSTDLSSTGVRNRRAAALAYAALPSTCPSTSKSNAAHIAVGLKIA